MATTDKCIEMSNRLKSIKNSVNPAMNHIIAGADDIYDDELGKKLSELNAFIEATKTAVEELSPDLTEALALATDVADLKDNVIRSDSLELTAAQKKQARANLGFGDGDIDSTPTSGSTRLVTSGGVFTELSTAGVYDVSVRNDNATFASLSALLSDADLDTLIPVIYRKGGMSIKFVNTESSQYEQYRFLLNYTNNTAGNNAFKNIDNWTQGGVFATGESVDSVGIDAVPATGSNNLVKSGGVYNELRPFIISGTTESTWKQIWSDANSPIPAGSIIENDGDLDVNVIDSMSTSEGSYNFVLIPANGSLTCEWAVYRIKTTNAVGSYHLKVHKANTISAKVAKLKKDIDSFTDEFASGESVNAVTIAKNFNTLSDEYLPTTKAVNTQLKTIRDDIKPQVISGEPDKSYAVIWINETDPIPTGVTIENKGNLSVNVHYDLSGEDYEKISVNGKLVLARPVYKIRTIGPATGNYELEFYYPNTLIGRVEKIEEEIKGASINSQFASGESVSDLSIVNDLSGQIENAIPSAGVVKENFDNINTLIGGDNSRTLPTITYSSKKEPARNDGTIKGGGYFSRYKVNLAGAYDDGYRRVRFYGFSYNSTNNVVQGIVITNDSVENADAWSVESSTVIANYIAGYVELPITTNSKWLIATILTSNGISHIGSKYPDGTILDFVPENVTILPDTKSGIIAQIEDLDNRVEALEEGGVSPTPTISFPTNYFPSKIYGIIGETQQEFIRGMIASMNPYQYYNRFILSPVHGKVYKRYLEITPLLVNGSPSSKAYVEHTIFDDSYNSTPMVRTPIQITRKENLSVPQGGLNVLCIGASTTTGGQWAGELKRRLTANDGTPVGYGLENINFVGRKVGSHDSNVRVEATGGWRWHKFFTEEAAIRFYVSGNPTVGVGDSYSFQAVDDGETVNISIVAAEVNISGVDGEDNIRFIYADQDNIVSPSTQSGILTGKNGQTINYTSYSNDESENYAPFSQNGKVTFVPYVNTYCGGKLDVLCCLMGSINIAATPTSDLNPTLEDIKTLLNALHEEYPNCKVLIGTAIPFSTYYGLEDDYGAGTNARSKYISSTIGAFRYVQMIDDLIANGYDDNEEPYDAFCYLVNTFTEVDGENIYPVATKAVNTRMPDVKEVIGTNGAHPNDTGYMMIADSFFRTFVNEVLTNNN